MKSTITFLAALLFFCVASAQNNYINYKALVKDNLGNVVANQSIDVRFTVFADAAQVYLETHNPTTAANGMIILDIGSGTTADTFIAIDWSTNTSLKTEIDTGSGYVDLGTTEFKSVPYALTAGNTVFSTTNNVTSNAQGDIATDNFIFGSEQLDHSAAANVDDSRLFFNKSKGAFRAGNTVNIGGLPYPENGTSWDDANIGNISFASGQNTVASGLISTAMGYTSNALGTYSTALGYFSTASGLNSTAMGWHSVASGSSSTAMGFRSTASGSNALAAGFATNARAFASLAIGRYNEGIGDPNSWIPADPVLEIGNGSDETNRSNALTVLKNGIVLAPTFDLSDYDFSGSKALVTKEYADGIAASGLEQITEGSHTGYRLKGSNPDNYGNIGIRAIDLSESDNFTTNGATGNYSFAAGINVISSGRTSFAFGDEAKAIMDHSIAIGALAEASKDAATAIGSFSKATGIGSVAIGDSQATGPYSRSFGYGANAIASHSIALGYFTKAESYQSTVIGSYNIGGGNSSDGWDDIDPLFEIGNGTADFNRSNALTVLKNGLLTAPSLTTTMITDEATGKALVTKEYVAGLSDFSTTTNVTSNAPSGSNIDMDDFVFGSTQLNHSKPIQEQDSRMYFDQSKSAFRAGLTINILNHPYPDNGTTWNATNIGESSFAAGFNTAATNSWTTAFGNTTIASGRSANAFGIKTKAQAYASTAIGSNNVGGGNPNAWILTDPLFEIGNANATDNNATASNAFTVLKNGNSQISGRLSIGTNTIGYLGSLAIKGDNNNDMIQLIDNNDNNKWHIGLKSSGDDISFSESLVADGRLYLQKGGNVGINTTSPTNKLTVKGASSNIEISNTEETKAGIIFNDSGDTINQTASIMYDSNGTSNDLYINIDGSQAILVDDNRNVIIGQTFTNNTPAKLNVFSSSYQLNIGRSDIDSEQWQLNVNGSDNLELRNSFSLKGTFNKTTGAYTQTSDRRLKTNILNLEPILDKLLRLNPSRYEYKANNPNHTQSIGLIAQDVKLLFPEFVNVSENEEGLHTLDYAGLSVIAIKAIKEQQQLIEAQNERIASLEEQNKDLQEDTAALASFKKDIEHIKLELSILATQTAKN